MKYMQPFKFIPWPIRYIFLSFKSAFWNFDECPHNRDEANESHDLRVLDISVLYSKSWVRIRLRDSYKTL